MSYRGSRLPFRANIGCGQGLICASAQAHSLRVWKSQMRIDSVSRSMFRIDNYTFENVWREAGSWVTALKSKGSSGDAEMNFERVWHGTRRASCRRFMSRS